MFKATGYGIAALVMLFVFAASQNCYAGGDHYRNQGNNKVADQGGKSFKKPAITDKEYKGKIGAISIDPTSLQYYLRKVGNLITANDHGKVGNLITANDHGKDYPNSKVQAQNSLQSYSGKIGAISKP